MCSVIYSATEPLMYHTLIAGLCEQLGLPAPALDQSVTSFAIDDERVVTLAEDEGQLVLYVLLPDHGMPNAPLLWDLDNYPVFQLGRSEGSTLLWCREWLDHLTVEGLASLLERALELADDLLAHRRDRVEAPRVSLAHTLRA